MIIMEQDSLRGLNARTDCTNDVRKLMNAILTNDPDLEKIRREYEQGAYKRIQAATNG